MSSRCSAAQPLSRLRPPENPASGPGYARVDDRGHGARPARRRGAGDAQRRRAGRPQDAALPAGPVQRVRKAYEQVYDQLRDLIMRGELSRGPGCRARRCSRASSASAAAPCARRSGPRRPEPDPHREGRRRGLRHAAHRGPHLDFLQANICLLSESDDVTLHELLETRELLEVFAARQCAGRRSAEDLERLRSTIIGDPSELGTGAHYIVNTEFHTALLDASGNTLVCIAAQPVFAVLQTSLRRARMPDSFARGSTTTTARSCGDRRRRQRHRRRRDARAHRVPQRDLPAHVATAAR